MRLVSVTRIPPSPFVFDLFKSLRDNPARKKKIDQSLVLLSQLEAEHKRKGGNRKEIQQELAGLVVNSGFNLGLTIPYVFPRFLEGAPLSFVNRPFMFALTCLAGGGSVTVRAGRQVGKCVGGNTTVQTNQGRMTMKELFDLAA